MHTHTLTHVLYICTQMACNVDVERSRDIFGGEIRKDTVMRRDVTIITMKTTSVWPDLSTENNEPKLYGKHNKK